MCGHWPVAIINQITNSGCKSSIRSSATFRSWSVSRNLQIYVIQSYIQFWLDLDLDLDPKFLNRAPDRPFYLNGMEWSGKKRSGGRFEIKEWRQICLVMGAVMTDSNVISKDCTDTVFSEEFAFLQLLEGIRSWVYLYLNPYKSYLKIGKFTGLIQKLHNAN